TVFRPSMSSVYDVVKLLDFGIAKLVDPAQFDVSTTGEDIAGTPAYMAPEQLLGHIVDARADLYAVGACMYEALTGTLPFQRESVAEVLCAIAKESLIPIRE